jgi:hypothetical protein
MPITVSINKYHVCYLFGIPIIWFAVAAFVTPDYADRIYLFAVAPAVWMVLFVEPLELTMNHFLYGGLAGISLVGPVLLLFKIKLRTAIIISLITTLALWLFFAMAFSHTPENIAREHTVNGMHTGITPAKVTMAWLACCFNFSLCLIPILAVPLKLLVMLKNKLTLQRQDTKQKTKG